MILNYNMFNEGRINSNKITYPIAGKVWNKLWDEGKYRFKDILFKMKYEEDDDLGIFDVLVYKDRDQVSYPGFYSIGQNTFHGIPEEREQFFKWLKNIGILE